jgi:hypothetical protein
VAPELLGAPTIGGRSAQPRGGGGGSPCHPICTKTGGFSHFLAYKLPKTPLFDQKYLTQYIPEMFFEEYINFKIFHY